MLGLIYAMLVIWIIYMWVIAIPQIEEDIQDDQTMGNIMKGSTFHLTRVAYFLTIIIFSPLDFILAFKLWRATPPLRNVGILRPLLAIYIGNRILVVMLVILLSAIVLTVNTYGYLFDIIYFSILLISIICIMIIVILDMKVLSHSSGDMLNQFLRDKGI